MTPHDLSREKIATALRLRADEHSANRDLNGRTLHHYSDEDARMDEAIAALLETPAAPRPPEGWREAWCGINKLSEEMHELLTVLDKIRAFPAGPHPGHGDLLPWLTNEIGDVQAALAYFCDANGIDADKIETRVARKLRFFAIYTMSGIFVPPNESKETDNDR